MSELQYYLGGVYSILANLIPTLNNLLSNIWSGQEKILLAAISVTLGYVLNFYTFRKRLSYGGFWYFLLFSFLIYSTLRFLGVAP
jgi:hypothetical protein